MKKLLPFLLCFALVSNKCKNSEQQQSSATEETKKSEPTAEKMEEKGAESKSNEEKMSVVTEPAFAKEDSSKAKMPAANNFRVVIEFFSRGEGTDENAFKNIQALVNGAEKDFGKTIAIEKYSWGREGEFDYCLRLSELSEAQSSSLVEKIKAEASKSKVTRVSENATSRHKR